MLLGCGLPILLKGTARLTPDASCTTLSTPSSSLCVFAANWTVIFFLCGTAKLVSGTEYSTLATSCWLMMAAELEVDVGGPAAE